MNVHIKHQIDSFTSTTRLTIVQIYRNATTVTRDLHAVISNRHMFTKPWSNNMRSTRHKKTRRDITLLIVKNDNRKHKRDGKVHANKHHRCGTGEEEADPQQTKKKKALGHQPPPALGGEDKVVDGMETEQHHHDQLPNPKGCERLQSRRQQRPNQEWRELGSESGESQGTRAERAR